MPVIDAGVVVLALAGATPGSALARARIQTERFDLHAPHLIDLEVTSVMRQLVNAQRLLPHLAAAVLADLGQLHISRVPHQALIPRCWALRHNLTAYDASYVALAEALDTTLITTDQRLANATGPRCPIDVFHNDWA